jgi:hypothetical protein
VSRNRMHVQLLSSLVSRRQESLWNSMAVNFAALNLMNVATC